MVPVGEGEYILDKGIAGSVVVLNVVVGLVRRSKQEIKHNAKQTLKFAVRTSSEGHGSANLEPDIVGAQFNFCEVVLVLPLLNKY